MKEPVDPISQNVERLPVYGPILQRSRGGFGFDGQLRSSFRHDKYSLNYGLEKTLCLRQRDSLIRIKKVGDQIPLDVESEPAIAITAVNTMKFRADQDFAGAKTLRAPNARSHAQGPYSSAIRQTPLKTTWHSFVVVQAEHGLKYKATYPSPRRK
ncbi:MAG: hypothetical protein P4M05_26715 [Bradyrhizobium sp.]|nr:hypothetical protein [Bradyrhizobium sp.]